MAECSMEAPDLVHARTMTYDLECNWKVFNDNYLVGSVLKAYACNPGMTSFGYFF